MPLDFITIPPTSTETPTGLIVALHGWGANAEDLASLTPFLDLPDYRFIFPNAPYPHPYSDTGKAWYDLRQETWHQGLPETRQLLTEWLKSLETTTNVPLSKTILAGFSQGGAMTLDVGLDLPLAGLISLSGYLHPRPAVDSQTQFPPTLIVHGRQDTVVPLVAAHKAKETLESLQVAVQYHEFDMGHEIRPEVLQIVRNFVVDVMN